MNVVQLLRKLKLINEMKQLEYYPPLFFMGIKVKRVGADYRSIHIHVPLRWYGTNMHGTMFGGFICAVSDPFAALLCNKIFPGTDVWTKKHTVEFIKGSETSLDLKIQITDSDVESIRTALEDHGKAIHTFEFDFTDRHGEITAHVTNTIYIRKKGRLKKSKSALS